MMYYNTNDTSNNDYYNSYKTGLFEKANQQSNLNRNRTIAFGLLLLMLIGAGYYFFNQSSSTKSKAPSIKIVEATEPLVEKNIPTQQATTTKVDTSNLSAKDIALIVNIIMQQMNEKKEPTTINSEVKAVDSLELENELNKVDDAKVVKNSQNLKDTNYYNKVVIGNNNGQDNVVEDEQTKLRDALNSVMEAETDTTMQPSSNYTTSINKEVGTRSNEMRIIVVQQGDTLSKIAEKAYGDYEQYIKIYNANPEILSNPDQIYVGQKIRIPE